METEYGIDVVNKYSFLIDDDVDPYELLEQQEAANQKLLQDKTKKDVKNDKAKKNKANKTTPAVLGATKTKPAEQVNRDDNKQNRRPQNQQNFDKRPSKEDFFNRERDVPPRRQGEFGQGQNLDGVVAPESNDGFRQTDGFRGRGRGGRGRGFGDRGGRGRGGFGEGRGGFGGKREFDRRSGSDRTGIKPVEKREGGGSYNWGTPEDDIAEPLNDTLNTCDEAEPAKVPSDDAENRDPQPQEPRELTEEELARKKEREDEEKEMTLDEYKASQAGRAKPSYNLRKAGEGCDDKQWKKTYLVQKKVEEQSEEESDEEEVEDSRHVNIEIRFNDPAQRGGGGGRGRGGRGRGEFRGRGGPRGGARGGGGFGNSQGSARKEHVPNVEDENDFPALG